VKPSLEQSSILLRVSNNCKRMARFDTERMLRAFVNLITNAQDAMPQGGEIRVTINERDKMIRFTVADNGTGIPPEIKGRIFDAFVTAGKKKGTGLGLAITKRIIDQHGGSIEVQSERGKGTSFTVEIPVF
jgi:signal transduction histidine kinase